MYICTYGQSSRYTHSDMTVTKSVHHSTQPWHPKDPYHSRIPCDTGAPRPRSTPRQLLLSHPWRCVRATRTTQKKKGNWSKKDGQIWRKMSIQAQMRRRSWGRSVYRYWTVRFVILAGRSVVWDMEGGGDRQFLRHVMQRQLAGRHVLHN